MAVVCKPVSGVLALLGLVFSLMPQMARAETINPLFFDGFESDIPDTLNATLINWITTTGSVDVLTPGNLCGAAGNFSQCVDLDGTGNGAGTIQSRQTFALSASTYRLTFDLAGANRPWPGSETNTVTVSFGGFFAEAFTMLQYDPFQTFTRDIVVPSAGTANIVFNHQGADWIGILLDNVALSQVIPDVPQEPVVITPEPGTFVLLGAALGLLALRYSRKRA